MSGKEKLPFKRDFGQSEMAAELNAYIQAGVPKPREAKSQKAQLKSEHKHGTRKDFKIKLTDKLT